ncbi:hypothetical protein Tco_1259193 [Tanacetum coccineum]
MRDIMRLKRERELVRVKIHDGNAFWNEIGVNGGVSKLMLLSLNLLLLVLVYAARHSLTTVRYALTVNPTIYTTCIEQFWSTVKVKTVNRESQIQALVNKKKVIITEMSIRSDLKLEDAEGTYCLPTATIFVELERMKVKFLMSPRFVQVFLDNKVEEMTKHKGIYVTPSHTKKVFDNMKRLGKGFSGKVTHLFQTMMVQAPKDMEPIPDEATNEEHVFTPSYDPPQRGEDRLQLTELMSLCTSLQDKVLDLEKAKTAQAKEIASEEVVAEKEVAEKEVSAADLITIVGEVVTTTNVEVTTASAPTTNIDELTLDQTLIEIKAAKPKAITIDTTTTTTTRPKARGVVVQEPSEFKTTSSPSHASQLLQAKDKGKAILVEPEKPLKKKDQIALDEEVARNLEAQLQAKLEEEERLTRKKEQEATIALIES